MLLNISCISSFELENYSQTIKTLYNFRLLTKERLTTVHCSGGENRVKEMSGYFRRGLSHLTDLFRQVQADRFLIFNDEQFELRVSEDK